MCRKLICLVSFVLLLGLAHDVSAEIPRDPNLVIYYSYEDVGLIVPDESGKGHNGTVCGDVSAAPSGIKWYGAAEFLGEWGPTKYSYLDLDSPHYPAVDIPKSAITLAAWVECRKTGKDHAIISCRAADNTWVVHPQINDNGTFRWLLRAAGSSQIFNLNGVGTHGWDEWIHYAGTYDSVTGKGVLYIGGEVCATIDVAPGQRIADWGTGARVGYNIDGLVWGTTYYWRIDGVNAADPNTPWKGDVWSFLLRPATAWNPNPSDGAKWIDPNADLSWSPGRGAIMHYVYFGESLEDVKNGTGGTLKATPTDAQCPAGFEKVYYWRVDEFDGSATHKGNVWHFTSLRSGSGVRGQYYKDVELKTLVLTRADPGINFNWGAAAPAPGVPADNFSVRWTGELEVPFTSAWTFTANCDDCVRLWVNGELLFDKWGQQSGVEWTGTIDLAAGQKYSVVMEYYENTGDARAILYWNSPSWLTPYQPKQIVPQGAFSLPLRARSPEPANGAVDVRQTPILRWTPGEMAVSHDVYFGEDANAVANATTATADICKGRQALDKVTYDPGTLEWGKTYYWRVDEVNDASPDSPWQGSVWTFTVADFLVVDDMESYTDDEGNRIYEIWIDGWTNSTGSVVGNLTAPFAEQTIVHAGRQSMPMDYDNGKSPFYSEAELAFAPVQDWTVNGVTTLVLFVRGVETNGAGNLYVVVEDSAGKSAVVSNPDASVVTKTVWTEWKVPMSSFTGVNAAKVKKLYVGVGDRQSPKSGGFGRLYLDDIRVVKP